MGLKVPLQCTAASLYPAWRQCGPQQRVHHQVPAAVVSRSITPLVPPTTPQLEPALVVNILHSCAQPYGISDSSGMPSVCLCQKYGRIFADLFKLLTSCTPSDMLGISCVILPPAALIALPTALGTMSDKGYRQASIALATAGTRVASRLAF